MGTTKRDVKVLAVGYARASTGGQEISPEMQAEKIRQYCGLRDMQLAEIVTENVSAKNTNRPGLQKVLGMVKAGKVGAVIVWKIDRMARSTVDSLQLIEEFDRRGVAFVSICEQLDTASAHGRFFFTITSAYAEMERRLISERTSAALQHMRATGRRVSRHEPYGYRYDATGKKLIAVEQEQQGIRRMVELRSSGVTFAKIAAALDAEGFKCKRAARWSSMAVKLILDRHAKMSQEQVSKVAA